MTSQGLARSYLAKARGRLKALAVLRDEGDHSDVVREAQELVELEQYSAADAARAWDEAAWIVALAEEVIGRLPG